MLDAVRQCVAAGKPVSYVVVANEVKASQAVRAASPDTLVHFRITGHDYIDNPSRTTGAERVRWLLPLFRDSQAQLLSIANEWMPSEGPGIAACVEAYLGAMDAANEAGIKIAVGDFSLGNPHIDAPGVMDMIRPMLSQAERDGHYLSVNSYVRDSVQQDPDSNLWQRMTADYPHLRVVMREYNYLGSDPAHGERFDALMRAADLAWGKDERFCGAAIYTLSGYPEGAWKAFEYPGELAQYVRYVSSM